MTSEDIDVEAGLIRDHERRILLTVCRYSLCAVALLATVPPMPPVPPPTRRERIKAWLLRLWGAVR